MGQEQEDYADPQPPGLPPEERFMRGAAVVIAFGIVVLAILLFARPS